MIIRLAALAKVSLLYARTFMLFVNIEKKKPIACVHVSRFCTQTFLSRRLFHTKKGHVPRIASYHPMVT